MLSNGGGRHAYMVDCYRYRDGRISHVSCAWGHEFEVFAECSLCFRVIGGVLNVIFFGITCDR